MAMPLRAAINPTVSGRYAACKKGPLTQPQMKRALIVTVVLICLSGAGAVVLRLADDGRFYWFHGAGEFSDYRRDHLHRRHPAYGYIGLGDISVLVFFGWLSVAGSWYLQAHTIEATIFLPATACGLLAAAVLNINNLRDIDSDRENGKNTLAVRLGPLNARRYHACLLIGAPLCLALFTLISLHSPWGWLFLLATPLLVKQARFVMREREPVAMRPMLERTVKAALLTNLLFVIGIICSKLVG